MASSRKRPSAHSSAFQSLTGLAGPHIAQGPSQTERRGARCASETTAAAHNHLPTAPAAQLVDRQHRAAAAKALVSTPEHALP